MTEPNLSNIFRQFSRSYTLPSNCKVQEMKSSFGNGKLVISVPKSRPAITSENTRTETTNGVGKMAGNSNGNIHVTTTKHSSSNGGQTIRCIPIDRKMAGNSNGSTNIPIDRTYTSRATINTGDGDRYTPLLLVANFFISTSQCFVKSIVLQIQDQRGQY